MYKLLIIDDEPNLRAMLALFFEKKDFNVHLAESGKEALKILENQRYDAIISDVRMPDLDGMALLEKVNLKENPPPMILITAYGSQKTAVEAIKKGAFDYITKPFDMEELYIRVNKAIERINLEQKVYTLEEELTDKFSFGHIIGKSTAIRRIVQKVKQVSQVNTTLLITGESGTGKEIIARAIHYSGPRKSHRFVSINCGALPEPLLESELFGYVRGAFTGAESDRIGLFKEADKGTIFLDEIGEMTPSMQVKLLRVLQDKKVRPVGSTRENEVDVRVIAATHQDLSEAVKKKIFREDLYYRINVIQVSVPPLRHRKEDIPILVNYFINKFSKEHDLKSREISLQAMKLLENYQWPGNVRELENVIERSLTLEPHKIISESSFPDYIMQDITIKDFSLEIPEDGMDLQTVLDHLTVHFVKRALDQSGGSQAGAAKLLGLTPRALRYIMEKHNIPKPDRKQGR